MKIAIIYYSTYGHIVTMAQAVKEGVEKSGKASKVDIFQVPETLPQEVLEKLKAPAKADYPIATLDTLSEYDAFVFGYPTRFGNLPAQMTEFLGATGGLWANGTLYGKPVAIFTSVSSPGGGQEATLRNFIPYIAHHGMIYIPLGYAKAFAQITNLDEVHGGTPYGAVTFAGDGSRQPTALEKEIATLQGEAFADNAIRFVSTVGSTETATKAEKAEEPKKAKESKETEAETKAEKPASDAAKRTQQTAPSSDKKEESGCGVKCVIV